MYVVFPFQVLINLGLVYKVQQHNGIIFQFVAIIRRRQRAISEILAAGGRYDLLVRACPAFVDLFRLNFILSQVMVLKFGVPIVAQWLTNLTGNHEVAGSIPGLAQWLKIPALP